MVLLLNESIPLSSPPSTAEALAYSFNAPSRLDLQNPPAAAPPPSEATTIPVVGVRAGSYLVRIQVNGAESPLGSDADGRYNSPQLPIP